MSDQFPPSWRTVELRQIASFVSGGTPNRKEEKYFTGTIPWLTGYDLPEDMIVDIFEGREQITEDAIRGSATSPVEAGTVLLTTRVTVGKVAIARTKLCFSQDITGIIIEDTNVLAPEFLAHYLLAMRELLLRRNRGSTIQGVIRRDVERLQIPIPALSEQKRIVEILHQSEELRQIRYQSDERIQSLRASLFYKIFGDPIANSKQWQVFDLKDTASFINGGTPDRKTEVFFEGEIPWLTGFDLLENKVIDVYTGREYITQEAIRQSATNLVGPETVLLTTRVTVGKVAIAKTRLCFSQDITGIVIKEQDKITPLYLAHYLFVIRELLLRRNRGSTIQGIIRRDLERLQIPIPNMSLQQEFIQQIAVLDETLKSSDLIRSEIEGLQQSVINRAFTGDLTHALREAAVTILHDETAKRDSVLSTLRIVDLESKQSTEEVLVKKIIAFDENHPRYEILKSLSDAQSKIYFAIQQHNTYFTTQSLSDEDDFPLEAVRRTLPLLETLGLIRQVSVAVSPNNTDVYFIDAYRKPADKDNSRFNDIETLSKFISDTSTMNPLL